MQYYQTNPLFITPESRKNEMIQTFIKPGLEDLCVSRTSFSWGVKVKEDPRHVVYVWLDALTNYITALGYGSAKPELYQKFWEDPTSEIVHIVGSDITRFHVIYWPIFLMALGLRLPDRVFAHGLLMMKDTKMSKSRGNVVDPLPLIEKYGVDSLRYFLVRETIFGSDGQFSPEQFVERVNSDLANDFGNLLNRTINMVQKYCGGVVPSETKPISIFDQQLSQLITKTVDQFTNLMDQLQITEAYSKVNQLVARANKYIDESLPWQLAKDPAQQSALHVVLHQLIDALYVAGTLYQPILVTTSAQFFNQLGVTGAPTLMNLKDPNKVSGLRLSMPKPLFPRLDALIEVPYIQNLVNS
jgi:methionyl-tRNA synthetase